MFRSIAINTIVSFGARIIGVVLGFFVLAITTRALGIQGFGLYSTALSWAYLFTFIADLGLYNLLTKEIGHLEGKEEKNITSLIISLRLISLAISLGVGIIVSLPFTTLLGVSTQAIVLASLMYGFLSLSQVLMGVFQKYLHMEWPALSEITGRSFMLLGLVALLYVNALPSDYHIFLLFPALAALLALLLNVRGARRFIRFTFAFDAKEWKHLFATTFPIGAAIILTAVYFKLDTLFIAFFRSQTEVGLYNAAYRILENLIFFPAAFVGILMPHLSRTALTDKKGFNTFFQYAFDILLIISLPLVCGIIFEAPRIIGLIAGEEFIAASGALVILAFATGIIFFSTLFSQALIALDLQKYLLWVYGFAALMNVTLNFFIVPLYGYIGAAVTTLWTEALVAFLMVRMVEQKTPLVVRFVRFFPTLGATLVMGVFLAFTQMELFMSIPLAIFIYGVALWMARGVRSQEIKELLTP